MIEPSGELARVIETAKQGGYPTVRALGADLATALKAATPRSGEAAQKLVLSMNGEQLTFDAGADRRIILGRASTCEVVLATSGSSRKHAMLIAEGERWFLRDLGSSNGTYLNGDRIGESTELKHGDRIGIGEAIITVVATK